MCPFYEYLSLSNNLKYYFQEELDLVFFNRLTDQKWNNLLYQLPSCRLSTDRHFSRERTKTTNSYFWEQCIKRRNQNLNMVLRIPYERESDDIDVNTELENLRHHYAKLQQEKEMKKEGARRKAMKAKPSEAQLRLYREGVHKISSLKLDEDQKKAFDPFAVPISSRNASPSPVCDRLYEQGMLKKHHQAEEEKRLKQLPLSTRRNVSSSPLCDRLYQEGVAKIKARNSSVPRHERSSSKGPRRNTPVGRRVNELYELGKTKIRSRSRTRKSSNHGFRGVSRSASPGLQKRTNNRSKLPPSFGAKTQNTREHSDELRGDELDEMLTDEAPASMQVREQSPATSHLPSNEDEGVSFDESPRASHD